MARQLNKLGVESLEHRDLMSASPLPVLLVIADQRDFYYREYADTRAALESQGVEVVVGAATTNPSTPHWNTGQPAGTLGTVTPDVALGAADAADYSAIAFVGGWGASMYQYAYNDPDLNGTTDNFYADPLYNGGGSAAPQKVAANELVNDFLAADKPVAGLCHGVTVLAWARVDGASPLAGRQVAVPHLEGTPDQLYAGAWRNGGYYSGQRDQVVANGGLATASSGAHGDPTTTADDVIVDGRIITGENPASATLFGTRIGERVLAALPPVSPPPAVQVVDGNLVVHGTAAADTVYLWSGAAANQVFAWVNGTSHGPYTLPAGGRVVAHAGDGNDQVFATDLRVGAVIDAGAGHDLVTGGVGNDVLLGGDGVDRLWGGSGDDLIRGGAGDDYLFGREGNDVLVGGLGNDWLDGGGGENVLIAETATADEDAALATLHGVWVSAADFDAPAVGVQGYVKIKKLNSGG